MICCIFCILCKLCIFYNIFFILNILYILFILYIPDFHILAFITKARRHAGHVPPRGLRGVNWLCAQSGMRAVWDARNHGCAQLWIRAIMAARNHGIYSLS